MGRGDGFVVPSRPGYSVKKLLRAAVAAASHEDKEPPPILSLYWQCMKWGTLPEAGGMNDQDYRTIFMMTILSRVYDAALAWHSPKTKMTADQERVFLWLHEIGVK